MTSLPPQESAPFAPFTAENRLYELITPLGADTLIVEHFIDREALSTLTAWHIDCLSTGLHLPLKPLLGQQAVLPLAAESCANVRSMSGAMDRRQRIITFRNRITA